MIPVLNEPAIQFSVREAADAGIEHIVFVISRGQEATNDYFKPVPALEDALEQRGNTELLNAMREISSMIETQLRISGRAAWTGTRRPHGLKMRLVDEPFAVFLPDDIIFSDSPVIGEMIDVFSKYGSSVIAVKRVPDEAIPRLGIIDPKQVDDKVYQIRKMVEKPRLEDAPSDLAIVARYVLTPEIFDVLEKTPPSARNEIELTDALEALRAKQCAYAYQFDAYHVECGDTHRHARSVRVRRRKSLQH